MGVLQAGTTTLSICSFQELCALHPFKTSTLDPELPFSLKQRPRLYISKICVAMPELTWTLTGSAFLLVRTVPGLRGQGEQAQPGGRRRRDTGIRHGSADASEGNPGTCPTPACHFPTSTLTYSCYFLGVCVCACVCFSVTYHSCGERFAELSL